MVCHIFCDEPVSNSSENASACGLIALPEMRIQIRSIRSLCAYELKAQRLFYTNLDFGAARRSGRTSRSPQ